MKISHTPQSWGINLQEFEKGGWGTAFNGFKVPKSIIQRFRKNLERTNEDTGEIEIVNVFDAEKVFDELAFTYINALVAMYEILRMVPFHLFEDDTKENLRLGIYNAIEFSAANRQFWENINGSQISAPNFNISVETTNWLLTADMMGTKAHNLITNSGLIDYEIINEPGLMYHVTQNGNTKVIGKIDLQLVPDLFDGLKGEWL